METTSGSLVRAARAAARTKKKEHGAWGEILRLVSHAGLVASRGVILVWSRSEGGSWRGVVTRGSYLALDITMLGTFLQVPTRARRSLASLSVMFSVESYMY